MSVRTVLSPLLSRLAQAITLRFGRRKRLTPAEVAHARELIERLEQLDREERSRGRSRSEV